MVYQGSPEGEVKDEEKELQDTGYMIKAKAPCSIPSKDGGTSGELIRPVSASCIASCVPYPVF
jgi:hypothetical protein